MVGTPDLSGDDIDRIWGRLQSQIDLSKIESKEQLQQAVLNTPNVRSWNNRINDIFWDIQSGNLADFIELQAKEETDIDKLVALRSKVDKLNTDDKAKIRKVINQREEKISQELKRIQDILLEEKEKIAEEKEKEAEEVRQAEVTKRLIKETKEEVTEGGRSQAKIQKQLEEARKVGKEAKRLEDAEKIERQDREVEEIERALAEEIARNTRISREFKEELIRQGKRPEF